jgi:tRNA(Phe) wybutosine-synthesizing methylase Tyw3
LKDVNEDLVKNLVSFENEKVPKYSNKLKLIEQKFSEMSEKVT